MILFFFILFKIMIANEIEYIISQFVFNLGRNHTLKWSSEKKNHTIFSFYIVNVLILLRRKLASYTNALAIRVQRYDNLE